MKNLTKLSLVFIALFAFIYESSAQNTTLGTGAGNSGTYNTSIGYYAGDVVTGTQNTFIGGQAGISTTSGNYNSFVGVNAGYYNTTGYANCFFGRYSGFRNVSGTRNAYFGYAAGNTNTRSDNVFMGYNAGSNSTSGYNTCIGTHAGNKVTGDGNTYLGYAAGYNTAGTYNVFIGYNAGRETTGDNNLIIDNDAMSTPLISGNFESQWVRINNKLYTNTFHALSATIDGKITCESIEVKDVAADFVFEKDYSLRSLQEVEAFINENGHLPDVAPASETAEGVNLVEFNTLLLQKIEELTLYMIELQKENESIKDLLKQN